MDISDIKRFWLTKPLLVRLIIVNVTVFLIVRIAGIVAMIGGWSIDPVVDFLALPSSLGDLAVRPWTPLTYMFMHYDVFHILFNMLFLYWFGGILLMRCTPRQLMGLYVYCGFAGAVAFVAAAQVFAGVGGYLLGASASVMGIMVASAVLMPDMEVGLLLIGRVKLKWVACATVALFALGLVGDNAGGHVAHLGGMAMGAVFALRLNRGRDITRVFNSAIDWIVNFFSSVSAKKVSPRGATRGEKKTSSEDDRRELDRILDKIKQSGYTALSAEERRRLFDVSSRIK